MKKLIIPILIIIVACVLIGSFNSLKRDSLYDSKTKDVVDVTVVDGVNLEVKYNLGNMIDEEIPYGNRIEKIIDISNKDGKDVSFAVKISEVILSGEYLKYNVLYSYDGEVYNKLSEGINLTKDDNLAYNLVVSANSTLSLKLEFLGINQIEVTKFSGKLSVISNLSDKDIYRKDALAIVSNIETNIRALNGINESGYFIVNVSTLKEEISSKFKGFVLIDAKDYSDLKYNYFIYDDKYMLNNYRLEKNDVDKKKIQDVDDATISNFTFDKVCSNFTRKGCKDFSSILFNPNGGKDKFYIEAMEVINSLQSEFKEMDKKVYVYDVKNDITNNTSVRGYILVNNTVDTPEYYLYLTNDLYMISGYNLTKLGAFSVDSKTIRSYSESSFNLSSSSKETVCAFSGFSECASK